MSGAFDSSFQGDGRARVKDQQDPGVVAACADRPAEAAVIGALLRDDDLIDDAADKLTAEDFSDLLLAQIFSTIISMRGQQQIATPITVAQRFAAYPDMQERGGAKWLAQLASSDRADRGIGYVEHLVDLSRRRALALAMGEIRPQLADTGVSIDTVITQTEVALSCALQWTTARPAIAIAQAWDIAMDQIREAAEGGKRGLTLPTFPEWNEITGGGMVQGQLVLLGGRPGMGKTAVAVSVARHAAAAGHGVLFISREMPVEQLMMRMVADLMFEEGSSVTLDDILHGRLGERDYQLAAQIRRRIDAWPLVFEEPAGLNATRVAPIIRRHQRMMAQKGVTLGLVVVDYIGLLDPPQARQSREQEVSDTSKLLKNTARATNVAMLALAQLNRAVEQRDDKHPMLSDLRDSGSLEQDADTVVFAYREEYYLKQTEPDANDVKKRDAWQVEMTMWRNRLEIYSAKVRQGAPTRRKVYFFGPHQAVRSADYYQAAAYG
ncbi:replicative DNA helicase [Sphingobium yanoikuyae]|uniref:replicative DNA helicase n=1 Tax=Sphingobium yanoikuyae TaxID=13690 RepID=UPI003B9E2190